MKNEINNRKEIRKILVIKLRGMGDVVLSTIVLNPLKENFPDAKIDFLTEKPSNQLLEPLEEINKIIVFNRKSTFERFLLFFKIRRNNYDLVIDLFSNPATAQITFFSGARYRLGFPYRGRKYAYNYFGPTERNIYHSADLHLKLLEELGIKYKKSTLDFGLFKHDLEYINNYLAPLASSNKLICIISPSGGWNSKKCDTDILAKIADLVIEKYNVNIIIVWGPGDKNDAHMIQKQMQNPSFLAPSTSIRQMGALFKAADFTIANDSGPMHISAAVGTPTLSLHGPTSPTMQGPYGVIHETVRHDELDCIECNLIECPIEHQCFRELPIEKVMDKIDRLLKKNNLLS